VKRLMFALTTFALVAPANAFARAAAARFQERFIVTGGTISMTAAPSSQWSSSARSLSGWV